MSPWELDGAKGRAANSPARHGARVRLASNFSRRCSARNSRRARRRSADTGFKAITMTTAWQVGGAATEAANIWTDTVGDMIDRHNYAEGRRRRPRRRRGQGEQSVASSLRRAAASSRSECGRVEDKPFCVTEWTQSAPNQWKIRGHTDHGFYGLGLQGWDRELSLHSKRHAAGRWLAEHVELRDGYACLHRPVPRACLSRSTMATSPNRRSSPRGV
jgi:hypothetical protein